MLLAPLFFALSSGKGLYTLLLGSGVSSGAGIPTGHQVMLDLIERLAGVSKQTADPSPEAWYERQFGAPPTYSALLDKMTQTPAERANLLHAYFEPTPEERAAGRKVPTAAHHAVATLAKRGYIRLVLTTNFDSLLEQAMRQAGLDPVIVSRPDDVAGLRPLSHVDLCIVKLHGDYHDLRTLNTQSELANYDPAVTQLLTRVLTDYGLIVSGWSGEHDTALLRLVAEVKSPHYGTYWAHRGSLTPEAQSAIVARGAMPLQVSDADSFFHEIAEGLEALEESSRQTLQGEDVMFARLKRYMQAEDRWIDLDELVQSEAERVASRLTSERFRFDRDAFGRETFVARATDYETIVKTLARCLL